MPFWKNYYHLVWTTKNRQAFINEDIEKFVFAIIHRLSEDELGSHIFALNGTTDHLHVAVAIPPKLAVSDWIKRVKGNSSHAVNVHFALETAFAWQPSFGSSTFGMQAMPIVTNYIEQQKERHANSNTIDFLERTEDEDD